MFLPNLLAILLLLARFSSGIRWGSEKNDEDSVVQPEELSTEKNHCDLSEINELLRRSSPAFPHRRVLQRRQNSGSTDVSTDSVGVALGNTTVKAKLGNVNITVQNVTITTGNIDVQDITIGNITVLVNVNLAELGKILPLGNLTLPQLPSVSLPITLPTLSSLSTVIEGETTTVTPTPTTISDEVERIRRDATGIHLGPRQTSVPSLPSANADVSTGDILVDAEIGNVTLSVENINITLGTVTLKNITVGNVLVLVNLGTNSDLSNLTNLAANS